MPTFSEKSMDKTGLYITFLAIENLIECSGIRTSLVCSEEAYPYNDFGAARNTYKGPIVLRDDMFIHGNVSVQLHSTCCRKGMRR